jgi:uncharacterized protein
MTKKKVGMRSKLAAIAVLIAVLIMPLYAASAESPTAGENTNARTIEVAGNGEAQAVPDLATLAVAIETQGPTAAEAASRNASLAQKVVEALKAKLGDKGKISTGGYTLDPEYNEPRRENEKPMITGYRAQNSITVETGSLELLGPLIDAAIEAGANRVNALDFSLRDDTKARTEAIAKAAKDAQSQAQALAASLGVKLGPIVKASTVAQVRPILGTGVRFAAAIATSAPTPVQPGEVTVPATVSLTYEIQ